MQDDHVIPEAHYREAADYIRSHTRQQPTIGLVLGSGLGPLIEAIEAPDVIDYADIPHWPHSTVQGHAGRLVIGQLEGRTVVAMQGRIHFYEGYTMAQVTLPVRVMKLLGVDTVILTNAAGGLNPAFSTGDIMLINDHINLPGITGTNPLIGPNLESFGPRFSIHTRMYNPALGKLAHRVAGANNLTLRDGIYVSLSGPTFETPAEVRMLRLLGGDSVGMSTAPEALVAYHTGMRVLGLSTITNMSIDSTETQEKVSHEDVLRLGRQIVPNLTLLLRGILRDMPPFDPEEMENGPHA
ncbi:MAG TPA: purine-nucleoside phosphorylase [Aggregatilinea sp.]|uniref:purine-nucleoside phosphorylase n=1 Tax=Aggregatilinea sp. TaxID=2806333 RepID=UPI002CD9E07F|nr:purine-nucleoside phosphorylase [Aggregatilinea sp.]HML24374.1 purine-nucleoside phosphorylase [Aggregatilinea sp.]